jgi:hypothetical protein
MTTHMLTRQRVKSNVSFGVSVPEEDRVKRLRWSAEEDTERDYGGPWRVTDVVIIKTVPENGERRYRLEKVYAIVTETKEVEI